MFLELLIHFIEDCLRSSSKDKDSHASGLLRKCSYRNWTGYEEGRQGGEKGKQEWDFRRVSVSAWSHQELRNVSDTSEFAPGGMGAGLSHSCTRWSKAKGHPGEKLPDTSRSLHLLVNGSSSPRAIRWWKSHRSPTRRKHPEAGDGHAEMGKADLRGFGGTPTMSTPWAASTRYSLQSLENVKPESIDL